MLTNSYIKKCFTFSITSLSSSETFSLGSLDREWAELFSWSLLFIFQYAFRLGTLLGVLMWYLFLRLLQASNFDFTSRNIFFMKQISSFENVECRVSVTAVLALCF